MSSLFSLTRNTKLRCQFIKDVFVLNQRRCESHRAKGRLTNGSLLPFASLRAFPVSRPEQVQFGRHNWSSNSGGRDRDLAYCHRAFGTSVITSINNNVVEKVVSAPNGIDFCVTIRNPDAPYPVICLPGALGTGPSDFANLLHDEGGGLGPEFGIYAFDPRGLGGSVSYNRNHKSKHGLSDRLEVVPRDYPIDFYVRDALDAAQVMKVLGYDQFTVLGWSDGANSAVHLASHPDTKDCVRNLVIWGGGAYVTKDDVESWESLRDVQKWSPRAREEKAVIHGGSLERLQQLNDAATDGWIRLYHNPTTNGDICLSVLHQVDCPTLVVHGGKDVICETKHARYIAQQISDATLTIFPEGKHNIHQRYAVEFHRLVRDFFIETMDEVDRSFGNSRSKNKNSDDNEQPAMHDNTYKFMESKILSVALKIGLYDGFEMVLDFLIAAYDNYHSMGNPYDIDYVTSINEYANGVTGSKTLSVALKIGLFDAIDIITKEHLSSKKKTGLEYVATWDQILERCHEIIPKERLQTLLSACAALKLIDRRVLRGRDVFSLPEASAEQLVRSSNQYWDNRYWGDYIVGQVDAKFYTRMKILDKTIITGDYLSDGYEAWFEKGDATKIYTESNHHRSLATGFRLLEHLPELSGGERYPKLRMLDVCGGSGSFSIATARKVKDTNCVILDFPNVVKAVKEIISKEEKQVQNRISTLTLSATAPDQWMENVQDESFDVVLISFVSGSISIGALSRLYRNAYRALRPGGKAVIHDFFVDNDSEIPINAVIWAMIHNFFVDNKGPHNGGIWAPTHVALNPEGTGLRPGRVTELLLHEGFASPKVDDLIPETTQLVIATKPGI